MWKHLWAFLCSLNLHSWHGCRCNHCGLLRPTGHVWVGCKCSVCFKTRNAEHSWDGCLCTKCGEIRSEGHTWVGCRCTRCYTCRDSEHNWDGCKCTLCGSTRSEGHVWDGCVCKRCGAVNILEIHQWIPQDGREEYCSKCGSTKTIEVCIKCRGSGKIDDPLGGWWGGYPATESNVTVFSGPQISITCPDCGGDGKIEGLRGPGEKQRNSSL